MLKIIHNFFIPHEGNGHKPHALRPKALFWYTAVLVGLKVITTVVLFVSYPDFARLSQELNQEIIRLINGTRAQVKMPPLIVDPELTRAAQYKANDMLARGYFNHITPEGKKPWELINVQKYPYRAVGENLAIDFVTSDAVHAALMASPSHHANIVQKAYQHVGIGVASGTFKGRDTNILVELFAASHTLSRPLSAGKNAKQERLSPSPALAAANPSRVLSVIFPETKDETNKEALQSSAVLPVEQKEGASTAPVSPDNDNSQKAQARAVTLVAPPVSEIAQRMPSASVVAFVYQLVVWTKRISYAALVYLALALSLTIFVRIRIQHASVIAQTIMLMVVISAFAFTDWHVLERLTSTVTIKFFKMQNSYLVSPYEAPYRVVLPE
ncbi:MAG: CAP domain-containing protein [Patescibacteria group bacterium]